MRRSGVLSTRPIPVAAQPRFGNLVAPGLYGPNHQHFFNVRLDMPVDGERNSVYEIDAVALPPGPDNPYGNGWLAKQTLLARACQAQRPPNPFFFRTRQTDHPPAPTQPVQPPALHPIPRPHLPAAP